MIVKNINSGKYEKIEFNDFFYFNIIFSKYNINILCPFKKNYKIIKEKIKDVY